ncbi:MAG: hypothetical protein ACI90Q_001773, partial [Nonlabens sp.]
LKVSCLEALSFFSFSEDSAFAKALYLTDF